MKEVEEEMYLDNLFNRGFPQENAGMASFLYGMPASELGPIVLARG